MMLVQIRNLIYPLKYIILYLNDSLNNVILYLSL